MYENAMSYVNAMSEYDKWWMRKWYVHRDALKRRMMWSRKQGGVSLLPNLGTYQKKSKISLSSDNFQG